MYNIDYYTYCTLIYLKKNTNKLNICNYLPINRWVQILVECNFDYMLNYHFVHPNESSYIVIQIVQVFIKTIQ